MRTEPVHGAGVESLRRFSRECDPQSPAATLAGRRSERIEERSRIVDDSDFWMECDIYTTIERIWIGYIFSVPLGTDSSLTWPRS
jgi:hypothetical protein